MFARVGNQFDEAVAITPLVVVPNTNLDKIAANDLGEEQVDRTRMAVANVVATDKRFLTDTQNTLVERFLRSLLECVVHVFDSDVFA